MSNRRAIMDGAIVGAFGAVAFLLLHAAIVEPIWDRAWRAPLAIANGVLLSLVYRRLRARERPTFGHPLGGMLLGSLAALCLAPFALAGWMRSRGAPDAFWILILGLTLLSFYHVTQAVQGETSARWRRLELPAAILVANALPAWFLTLISDFHEETPDPFPMTLALGCIYLASGAALTWLRQEMKSTTFGIVHANEKASADRAQGAGSAESGPGESGKEQG